MKSKQILTQEYRDQIERFKEEEGLEIQYMCFEALIAAESEIDEKDKEIARLKEYEWMYNQLNR